MKPADIADLERCLMYHPDWAARCKLHFNHIGPHQWWDGDEPAVHPVEWENNGWKDALIDG